MAAVRSFLSRLWSDEDGQALTEYALIIALIAVFVIAAVLLLGHQISNLFNVVSNCLSNTVANPGSCTP